MLDVRARVGHKIISRDAKGIIKRSISTILHLLNSKFSIHARLVPELRHLRQNSRRFDNQSIARFKRAQDRRQRDR